MSLLPEKELREVLQAWQHSNWENREGYATGKDDRYNEIMYEAITVIDELAINAMLEVIGPDEKLRDYPTPSGKQNWNVDITQRNRFRRELRNKLNKMRNE